MIITNSEVKRIDTNHFSVEMQKSVSGFRHDQSLSAHSLGTPYDTTPKIKDDKKKPSKKFTFGIQDI